MFGRWAQLQMFSPFSRVPVTLGDNEANIEPSSMLGDLPLDRFTEGDVNASWVNSNIWDVTRESWLIGDNPSENALVEGGNGRLPIASWNDVPHFKFQTDPSEIRSMFAGKVIRTGSGDAITSAKEAFARDCFLWSISEDISNGHCTVIPSCWAATAVETTVQNIRGILEKNLCESVTEEILMLTELPEGEKRKIRSPRFLVLNAIGLDREVDEEGVVWQEGKDSRYIWEISSDSPFSRPSGMNTTSPERLTDRKLRGAVTLMNCIKCLLQFGEASPQDYGQVSLWLENEGRWIADLVLDTTISVDAGDYKVCVTKDPRRNGRIDDTGIAIDYVYLVTVNDNMITGLQMSQEGSKGANDSRRAKLNTILKQIMAAKGRGELHRWLSQHIYDYVCPSFSNGGICYTRSPFRMLDLIDSELVTDHLDVSEQLCSGKIEVQSDEEREDDHLGVLRYDHSDDRVLLNAGFKGHKISWRHETLKLFRSRLGGIAVKREGAKLRSAKVGILAAIHRVVHDTGAAELGPHHLKWERVQVDREPETQIVLNSLLAGTLGVSGFKWAVAFLRDSGIKLTADSACYLKQFHATDGGGEITVRQILKSSVLRRLEAVEFTMDGTRCIGLDFCLPDTILRLDEMNNNAEVVLRQNCSGMVKGRIKNRFFLGGKMGPH